MCQTPLIVSVAAEIDASSKAVWAVLSDIENWPSVVTQIQSVKRLSNDEGFQEGTRWREVRKCGSDIVQIKTVTSIRDKAGCGKSVSINVSYPQDENKELTNTCTLEVRPLSGDKCLLVGSFGAMAGGIRGRCYFLFCGGRILRGGREFMLEELEEIGMAAVERHENGAVR